MSKRYKTVEYPIYALVNRSRPTSDLRGSIYSWECPICKYKSSLDTVFLWDKRFNECERCGQDLLVFNTDKAGRKTPLDKIPENGSKVD